MTTEEKAELLQLETDLCQITPTSLCKDYLSCCESCIVKQMAHRLFELNWRRIDQSTSKMSDIESYSKQSELTPCDVCQFSPPSSTDGKPCSVCPAQAKMKGD